MKRRIGALDLDGCIFDFNTPYARWFNQKYGCNIPMPSDSYPDTWNYPTDGGHVTKEQEREFWKWASTTGNYVFWRFLPAYPNAREFLRYANQAFTEIHFVTSRPGKDVKEATEDALSMMGIPYPNVHIADFKPPVLAEIGATDFLDDRDKNFEDVIKWKMDQQTQFRNPIKLWMLDRPWNRHYSHNYVNRVKDPMEIL